MPSLPSWLLAYGWIAEIAAAAALTAAAFAVWRKAQANLRRPGAEGSRHWRGIVAHALGAPLSVLIILLGLLQAGSAASFHLARIYPSIDDALSFMREAVVVVGIFWVLLRAVNGVENYYRHRKIKIGEREIQPTAQHIIFQSLRAVTIAVALLTGLETAGVSISGLLAFGGIGSVVIGFAAKDTLANFFAGMLIMWERPFVVGDWIRNSSANIEGVVEQIGWRMTQVRTFDQRPLYVPNSLFYNSVIENPQRMTNRRIYEYMGLRYEDIDKMPLVLADIRQLLEGHAAIDQNMTLMVNFDRYGASSLDFFVYAMTKTTEWKEFHIVKEKILLDIAGIVRRHGCEFAFPTRTVHHVAAGAPPLAP